MIFQPDYVIKTDGKEVSLLFNSLFFRQFCIEKGIELEDLFQLIEEGKAFKGMDLPLLLYHAAHTWHLYTEGTKPFLYNYPADACLWVDALGGFNSTELFDVYKRFVCKLSNMDPAKFDVELKKVAEQPVTDEEKKSEGTAVPLHGEALSA